MPSLKVFLSYAYSDSLFAKELSESLKRREIQVLANNDANASLSINENIINSINGCDAVIFIVSEKALHSPWFFTEMALALTANKQSGKPAIIPLRINDSKPTLSPLDNYLWINFANYIDDKNFEEKVDKVIEAIDRTSLLVGSEHDRKVSELLQNLKHTASWTYQDEIKKSMIVHALLGTIGLAALVGLTVLAMLLALLGKISWGAKDSLTSILFGTSFARHFEPLSFARFLLAPGRSVGHVLLACNQTMLTPTPPTISPG